MSATQSQTLDILYLSSLLAFPFSPIPIEASIFAVPLAGFAFRNFMAPVIAAAILSFVYGFCAYLQVRLLRWMTGLVQLRRARRTDADGDDSELPDETELRILNYLLTLPEVASVDFETLKLRAHSPRHPNRLVIVHLSSGAIKSMIEIPENQSIKRVIEGGREDARGSAFVVELLDALETINIATNELFINSQGTYLMPGVPHPLPPFVDFSD